MQAYLLYYIDMSFLTHHTLLAGPCSAETQEQVWNIAQAIQKIAPYAIFRAGLWKPRTDPQSFAGVGEAGLEWLSMIQEQLGMPVATEVATPEHIHLCMQHKIHHLWIGARTTANPIMMQTLADCLRQYHQNDIAVYIKNPINPDIDLWIGAIERIRQAGIAQIVAVHRGFSTLYDTEWRNAPIWSIPIELKRRYPTLPLICDPSHIAGQAERVHTIAQEAMEIGYSGLMIECHHRPTEAWSDASQQLTPDAFEQLLGTLDTRENILAEQDTTLLALRKQIDEIDDELWQLIARRLEVAQEIGEYKRLHNMPILQSNRYKEILQKRIQWAEEHRINPDSVVKLMEILHTESVKQQL